MSTIVAGYDGSPDSGNAVRWAAVEARARAATLIVCSAWDGVLLGEDRARGHGAEILRRGMGCALALLGPEQVESVLLHGSAAGALREAGSTAEMIVVGARGLGGLPGLLLGSVPAQLAGHCPVPLVVVRGHGRPAGVPSGPVVVGVDGSAGSAAAVEFALREAELRDLLLVAVCGLADAPGSLAGSRRVEEEFGELMSRLEKEHPDVLVQQDVLPGSARTALLHIAARTRARLIVVGTRGRGGIAGMPLGSVAQAMLHHAGCAVAVIPATR